MDVKHDRKDQENRSFRVSHMRSDEPEILQASRSPLKSLRHPNALAVNGLHYRMMNKRPQITLRSPVHLTGKRLSESELNQLSEKPLSWQEFRPQRYRLSRVPQWDKINLLKRTFSIRVLNHLHIRTSYRLLPKRFYQFTLF